jgi:hypothetical protein
MARRRKRGTPLENLRLFASSPLHNRDNRSKGKRDERVLGPKYAAGMRANRAAGEGEGLR